MARTLNISDIIFLKVLNYFIRKNNCTKKLKMCKSGIEKGKQVTKKESNKSNELQVNNSKMTKNPTLRSRYECVYNPRNNEVKDACHKHIARSFRGYTVSKVEQLNKYYYVLTFVEPFLRLSLVKSSKTLLQPASVFSQTQNYFIDLSMTGISSRRLKSGGLSNSKKKSAHSKSNQQTVPYVDTNCPCVNQQFIESAPKESPHQYPELFYCTSANCVNLAAHQLPLPEHQPCHHCSSYLKQQPTSHDCATSTSLTNIFHNSIQGTSSYKEQIIPLQRTDSNRSSICGCCRCPCNTSHSKYNVIPSKSSNTSSIETSWKETIAIPLQRTQINHHHDPHCNGVQHEVDLSDTSEYRHNEDQVQMLCDMVKLELSDAPDFIYFDAKWRIIEILRDVHKSQLIHQKSVPDKINQTSLTISNQKHLKCCTHCSHDKRH